MDILPLNVKSKFPGTDESTVILSSFSSLIPNFNNNVKRILKTHPSVQASTAVPSIEVVPPSPVSPNHKTSFEIVEFNKVLTNTLDLCKMKIRRFSEPCGLFLTSGDERNKNVRTRRKSMPCISSKHLLQVPKPHRKKKRHRRLSLPSNPTEENTTLLNDRYKSKHGSYEKIHYYGTEEGLQRAVHEIFIPPQLLNNKMKSDTRSNTSKDSHMFRNKRESTPNHGLEVDRNISLSNKNELFVPSQIIDETCLPISIVDDAGKARQSLHSRHDINTPISESSLDNREKPLEHLVIIKPAIRNERKHSYNENNYITNVKQKPSFNTPYYEMSCFNNGQKKIFNETSLNDREKVDKEIILNKSNEWFVKTERSVCCGEVESLDEKENLEMTRNEACGGNGNEQTFLKVFENGKNDIVGDECGGQLHCVEKTNCKDKETVVKCLEIISDESKGSNKDIQFNQLVDTLTVCSEGDSDNLLLNHTNDEMRSSNVISDVLDGVVSVNTKANVLFGQHNKDLMPSKVFYNVKNDDVNVCVKNHEHDVSKINSIQDEQSGKEDSKVQLTKSTSLTRLHSCNKPMKMKKQLLNDMRTVSFHEDSITDKILLENLSNIEASKVSKPNSASMEELDDHRRTNALRLNAFHRINKEFANSMLRKAVSLVEIQNERLKENVAKFEQKFLSTEILSAGDGESDDYFPRLSMEDCSTCPSCRSRSSSYHSLLYDIDTANRYPIYQPTVVDFAVEEQSHTHHQQHHADHDTSNGKVAKESTEVATNPVEDGKTKMLKAKKERLVKQSQAAFGSFKEKFRKVKGKI